MGRRQTNIPLFGNPWLSFQPSAELCVLITCQALGTWVTRDPWARLWFQAPEASPVLQEVPWPCVPEGVGEAKARPVLEE